MDNENKIYEHLSYIQKNLNAPKSRFNSFGKYNYRNCEDIVEAVKGIMPEGCVLLLSDSTWVSGDWHYIKATASFLFAGKRIETEAFARESLEKKGMDAAMCTGASSSYARKYALNGLFAIDDAQDADDQAAKGISDKKEYKIDRELHDAQIFELDELIKLTKYDLPKMLERYKVDKISDMTIDMFEHAKKGLKELYGKQCSQV